jgi:hypothetical protein
VLAAAQHGGLSPTWNAVIVVATAVAVVLGFILILRRPRRRVPTSYDKVIRPRRDFRRNSTHGYGLFARGYFDVGGFYVTGNRIFVSTIFGQTRWVDRSSVEAVVVVSALNDLRVTLVDSGGICMARDLAIRYTDEDIRKLAAALECPLRHETFENFWHESRAHPGIFAVWSLRGH